MKNAQNRRTHPLIPSQEGTHPVPSGHPSLEGIKRDRLLNVEQVADYLQLSAEHVRKLCRLRQIPCIKIGGNWRFDKMDIDVWIGEKKQRYVKEIRVVKNLRI